MYVRLYISLHIQILHLWTNVNQQAGRNNTVCYDVVKSDMQQIVH